MEGIVQVAVVVGFFALVQLYVTGHQRSKDKKEDWARQDELKDQEREEREEVAAHAAKAAALLLAENKKVATAAEETKATLKDIHTLVNSDMTEARQGELSTTRLLVVALRRGPQDKETQSAIDAAEIRANELETILADRLVAQQKVEADALVAAKTSLAARPDAVEGTIT